MRKELDDQLCRAYPRLYQNRHGEASKTCMHWGFSCGDGWYPLLDVLSLLVSRHDPNHSASQVKEKFGTLRYYFAAPNDYSAGGRLAGRAHLVNHLRDLREPRDGRLGRRLGLHAMRPTRRATQPENLR